MAKEEIIEDPEDQGFSAEANPEAIAQAYRELAEEQPVREVEMPGEGKESQEGPPTLGDAVNASEDLTDLQFAMQKLFPSQIDYLSVMIARIDPNVYIPMLHLMSVDEIMRSDPRESIDVNRIWTKNNIALSIGLDGMGRIDTAELSGAAREEKKAAAMLSNVRI